MLNQFVYETLRSVTLVTLLLLVLFFAGSGVQQLRSEWRTLDDEAIALLLPTPSQISAAWDEHGDVLLATHIPATLQATLMGLSLAICIGLLLAAVMDLIAVLRWILYPILVFSQTIPTFAIAVMLILLFGFGFGPKIVVVTLFTFFSITLNTLDGFQNVDPLHVDLLRSMNASPLQIWWKVRLPSAMPSFFSGLRLSATYSIVGAVVGEYVGGGDGLGKFLQRSYRSFQTDQVFLTIIIIAILSTLLLLLVYLTEALMLRWRYAGQQTTPWIQKITLTIQERFYRNDSLS